MRLNQLIISGILVRLSSKVPHLYKKNTIELVNIKKKNNRESIKIKIYFYQIY